MERLNLQWVKKRNHKPFSADRYCEAVDERGRVLRKSKYCDCSPAQRGFRCCEISRSYAGDIPQDAEALWWNKKKWSKSRWKCQSKYQINSRKPTSIVVNRHIFSRLKSKELEISTCTPKRFNEYLHSNDHMGGCPPKIQRHIRCSFENSSDWVRVWTDVPHVTIILIQPASNHHIGILRVKCTEKNRTFALRTENGRLIPL